MTCFHPLKAYRTPKGSGLPAITFNQSKSCVEGSSICVPCGRCIGCRLDRSRDYATRCMHEASLWAPYNSFLTLTYSDDSLPSSGSLDPEAFCNFMKRLRERLAPRRIRFFAVGEYGDENRRPHYHALIFNYDFPDKKFFKTSNSGKKIYTSQFLESVWTCGYAHIGSLTYESAAYCARYCMKKVLGDRADDHYCWPHPVTGELVNVIPEFGRMSTNPGLGFGWLQKFRNDVRPSDFVVVGERRATVPKYYDRKLKEAAQPQSGRLLGDAEDRIKVKRRLAALEHAEDATPARLQVRETVKRAQLKMLKRDL